MSDRTPTPGTQQAARIGEMTSPIALGRHKLSGICPDNHACTLPVHFSQLCSRLQSAEITAEMQAHVRAQRTTTKRRPG